jgi:hypothetical protein
MKKELLAAKLSQLGFADLEALKRLKSIEIEEMVRAENDEGDKMGFWDELANFNLIIDQVISNKIAELETNIVSI